MSITLLSRGRSKFGRLTRASACVLMLACASTDTGSSSSAVTGDEDDAKSDDTGKRDASTKSDAKAGTKPDTNNKADAGAKPTGRDSGASAPAPCAEAKVQVERLLPRVWLVVDGSGSMSQAVAGDPAGRSRFAVLREALLASGGPVSRLQDAIEFGLMIYDGGLSPPGIKTPLCPRLIVVEPATNNFNAIDSAYPQDPIGASTPTHYALLDLQTRTQAAPDAARRKTYVVLATDGKPNLCDFHDGIPASEATEHEAVDTVAELAADDIKTYAISMGDNDPALEAHLAMIAEAGQTGSGVFNATSGDELSEALSKILTGAVSCEVQISGKIVPGRECEGDVQLNDTPIKCDNDGYRVQADGQTLELLGAACQTLQDEPLSTLAATFACDDIMLL